MCLYRREPDDLAMGSSPIILEETLRTYQFHLRVSVLEVGPREKSKSRLYVQLGNRITGNNHEANGSCTKVASDLRTEISALKILHLLIRIVREIKKGRD